MHVFQRCQRVRTFTVWGFLSFHGLVLLYPWTPQIKDTFDPQRIWAGSINLSRIDPALALILAFRPRSRRGSKSNFTVCLQGRCLISLCHFRPDWTSFCSVRQKLGINVCLRRCCWEAGSRSSFWSLSCSLKCGMFSSPGLINKCRGLSALTYPHNLSFRSQCQICSAFRLGSSSVRHTRSAVSQFLLSPIDPE
jgi:hypothetical protein